MAAGAAVTVWGSFRPWLASGSAERSSYEVLGLVDRLGVARPGPLEWAVTVWPLMPLLVVAATALVWWGRPVLGSTIGLVAGAYAALVALAVGFAPGDGLVRSLPGTTVTLVGASVLLLGAGAGVIDRSGRVPDTA